MRQDEGSLGDQQWLSSVNHAQGEGSGRDSNEAAPMEGASWFLVERHYVAQLPKSMRPISNISKNLFHGIVGVTRKLMLKK